MKNDFGLAVKMAKNVHAKLALGEQGLRIYEEASDDPKCRGLDWRWYIGIWEESRTKWKASPKNSAIALEIVISSLEIITSFPTPSPRLPSSNVSRTL